MPVTTLTKVQCPCGTEFQTVPGVGKKDEDGNLRCDNCLVELGLSENLETEPPDHGPKPEPEGADAEIPSEGPEASQEPTEAQKVDLRTKEGRALKAAGLA